MPMTFAVTTADKAINSLINKEAFWVSNEEKLDARKPPRLNNSVIADAPVVKDISRLGVSETPTEILFDWLETLGVSDADCVDDGKILKGRLDIIVWDAGR